MYKPILLAVLKATKNFIGYISHMLSNAFSLIHEVLLFASSTTATTTTQHSSGTNTVSGGVVTCALQWHCEKQRTKEEESTHVDNPISKEIAKR